METSTPAVEWTMKDSALDIMGGLVFNDPNAPLHVPFSEAELTKWASEEYFLAFIPPCSIASGFNNANAFGRTMSTRIPLQYRNLAVVHTRGPGEWLIGKFGTEREGVVQKARHLAHLCIRWNEHPLMKQYYRSNLKSSTVLEEGRPPVVLNHNFRSVMLHCKPIEQALCLIGMTRRAFPEAK